jgi:hypothetical protein
MREDNADLEPAWIADASAKDVAGAAAVDSNGSGQICFE